MLINLIAILLGLALGMLVNYLSDVLPFHRRLVRPVCLACGAQYPLWRYFFWPRSCSNCRKSRSIRTWLVELFLAISGGLIIVKTPENLGAWLGLVLLAYLVLITVIDLEHRIIMHITSLIGAVLALVIGILLHGIIPTLIGGVVGFGSMLGIYYLGVLFLHFSRRKRRETLKEDEAIGFGDVNLSGIMGLLLGWPGIILGLLLAILLGGVAALIYIVSTLFRRSYHPDLSLPYGPFITSSIFILLYLDPKSWFN